MPNSWKGSRAGFVGIIDLPVILVLIATSKDQNRRPPEPWQTYIGCGCLGVANFFWIIFIS